MVIFKAKSCCLGLNELSGDEVNVIETLEKVIDVPVVKQVEVPQAEIGASKKKVTKLFPTKCQRYFFCKQNLFFFFKSKYFWFEKKSDTTFPASHDQVQTIEKIVEVPFVSWTFFPGRWQLKKQSWLRYLTII